MVISTSVDGSGAKSNPEDMLLTRVVDEIAGVCDEEYLEGSLPLLSLLLCLAYVSLPLRWSSPDDIELQSDLGEGTRCGPVRSYADWSLLLSLVK